MKPRIDQTEFGSITIEGVVSEHDVIIQLNGQVKKRKKKLSKAVYGTSHIISLEEVKFIYEKGSEAIIIGSGQHGMVKLSEEAADYLNRKKCRPKLQPTGEAIRTWNDTDGAVLGLFHITC